MDPLTMFSCPFRHDTTLQQHRLPSYGKRYEVEGRTNFLELRKREVRRRRLPRTPVNRGESTQTLSCLWWKGLEPAASKRATGSRKEEATNAAVHDAVRLHP